MYKPLEPSFFPRVIYFNKTAKCILIEIGKRLKLNKKWKGPTWRLWCISIPPQTQRCLPHHFFMVRERLAAAERKWLRLLCIQIGHMQRHTYYQVLLTLAARQRTNLLSNLVHLLKHCTVKQIVISIATSAL